MEGRKIIEILFVLLIILYIVVFRNDFVSTLKNISNKIDPCPTPIAYSIGQLDPEFNFSEDDFKLAIKEAEDIWEKAAGRDLFKYSTKGEMKINLIYDSRQESTTQINYLDNSLKQDNNTYLQLKSQYESLLSQYNQANQSLSNLISLYNQKLSAYESEIRIWNRKSGTQEKYNQLTQQKQELETLASTIKTKQSEVNGMISNINQLSSQLNILATNLNLNIAKYNGVVKTTDQEFEEGNYISNAGSKEINIYQFENRDKLVRVLAHELGHALGIDHIDNKEDIMYSYNIGSSDKITQKDLDELNQVCPE
jgi:predicted Zn-dependent protease